MNLTHQFTKYYLTNLWVYFLCSHLVNDLIGFTSSLLPVYLTPPDCLCLCFPCLTCLWVWSEHCLLCLFVCTDRQIDRHILVFIQFAFLTFSSVVASIRTNQGFIAREKNNFLPRGLMVSAVVQMMECWETLKLDVKWPSGCCEDAGSDSFLLNWNSEGIRTLLSARTDKLLGLDDALRLNDVLRLCDVLSLDDVLRLCDVLGPLCFFWHWSPGTFGGPDVSRHPQRNHHAIWEEAEAWTSMVLPSGQWSQAHLKLLLGLV